jgi:hypothetical protein
MAPDNGPGALEVGTNDAHEVVINLPQDMTGHIVFSPMQARILADSLIRKSMDAERADREAQEAARRAALPPVDRSKLCTTSGDPVAKVRAEQTEETGQHKGYIVLCEEERQKGFVRPYRDSYRHVTCGAVTTMGRALSETYARDPTFYGATFCVQCNCHLPVSEFVWTADGARLGS